MIIWYWCFLIYPLMLTFSFHSIITLYSVLLNCNKSPRLWLIPSFFAEMAARDCYSKYSLDPQFSGPKIMIPQNNYLSGTVKSYCYEGANWYVPSERRWEKYHNHQHLPNGARRDAIDFQREEDYVQFALRRDRPKGKWCEVSVLLYGLGRHLWCPMTSLNVDEKNYIFKWLGFLIHAWVWLQVSVAFLWTHRVSFFFCAAPMITSYVPCGVPEWKTNGHRRIDVALPAYNQFQPSYRFPRWNGPGYYGYYHEALDLHRSGYFRTLPALPRYPGHPLVSKTTGI